MQFCELEGLGEDPLAGLGIEVSVKSCGVVCGASETGGGYVERTHATAYAGLLEALMVRPWFRVEEVC